MKKDTVADLLSQMTIDEKLAQLVGLWSYTADTKESMQKELCDGIGQITRIGGASQRDAYESAKKANEIQRFLVENTRLKIPAILHEESCCGAMVKGASCFPQALSLAASFNSDLVRDVASTIAKELSSIGANQALAPVLDIAQDARWGRTEETFGEDPTLVAKMGVSYIRALQESARPIAATAKHFVGYGATEGGMNWSPANIPPRQLKESFFVPFEAAVKKAKLKSIMPSYNELDGIPSHANKELLTDILRDEWGFSGIVVSDYFAINMLKDYHYICENNKEGASLAIKAGVDVELPHKNCYDAPLRDALKEGLVSIKEIDVLVERVLKLKVELGLFAHPYIDEEKAKGAFDTKETRALAQRAAAESIILLKNTQTLPLSKNTKSIALIGPTANSKRNLIGDYAYPCHIESLAETTNTFDTPAAPDGINVDENFLPIISVLEAVKERVPKCAVHYAKGCDINTDDISGFAEAVETAQKADIVVFVAGDKSGLIDDCTSGEGCDRTSLELPGVQQQLLKELKKTGKPIVLVLVAGRPLSITWAHDNIEAILMSFMPGEEGARAITDVLFGDYAPSGRLPISFPKSVGQLPMYNYTKPSGGKSHWKGKYVEMDTKPLYPFGYGLSYTSFVYSDFSCGKEAPCKNGLVDVSFTVQNTGSVQSDEVSMVFIKQKNKGITVPTKKLIGFCRFNLKPNEEKTITMRFSTELFGFYNKNIQFCVTKGEAQICIGRSSDDLVLESTIALTGEDYFPKYRSDFYIDDICIKGTSKNFSFER